jgi:D-alanine-D-alanine ligase
MRHLRAGLTYNLKDDLPSFLATTRDASAEYDSQATVNRVKRALEHGGHEVVMCPYGPGLFDILRSSRPDIVFNIAEGWEGRARESVVPAVLEYLSIPYTGSDPVTLGLCLDKTFTKRVAQSFGIATAPFAEVTSLLSDTSCLNMSFPLFVKPAYEGSSKGITGKCLVSDAEELEDAVNSMLREYSQPVLIEEFLPGREFTVGIIGNDTVQVFPPMEVRPKGTAGSTEFVYCYDTKVSNGEELLCPAPISAALGEELRRLSVDVARAFKLRDFARIDFRLDRAGRVNLLEINPLPGFSEVSLYPLCAQAAGFDFDTLVNTILSIALRRYGLACDSSERGQCFEKRKECFG